MHHNTSFYRASNVASGSSTSPTARPTTSLNQHVRNLRIRVSPNTSQFRKAHSVSPQSCFASSQFQSSPSARAIPLPPTKWISPNEPAMRPPSSSSSVSSSDSYSVTSSSSYERPDENICGVRVCPLQLIAAVASS